MPVWRLLVGTFFGIPATEVCADVSETDDDLSAIADCFTSFSCAQLLGDEPIDLATQVSCLTAFAAF